MWNLNWIEKLKIDCVDEPDGGMSMHITWDETDPELAYWTSLEEEGQKTFMINALYNALECNVD
jgi:hypothetical protein